MANAQAALGSPERKQLGGSKAEEVNNLLSDFSNAFQTGKEETEEPVMPHMALKEPETQETSQQEYEEEKTVPDEQQKTESSGEEETNESTHRSATVKRATWILPVELGVPKKPVKYRQIKNTAVHRSKNGKKLAKFVINTRHCRNEKETIQYVVDLNRWEETKIYGEGSMIWYGQALRDSDIDVVRSRPKVYINRYPGSELLTRKKILCNIMNRMEKYFGREFEFTPLSYLLPEERDLLEEDMENNPDMWYIAKPSNGRGGEGIFLINKIEDIP